MESRDGRKPRMNAKVSSALLFTHRYYELETTCCRQRFCNNYTGFIIFALLVAFAYYLVTVSTLISMVTAFPHVIFIMYRLGVSRAACMHIDQ